MTLLSVTRYFLDTLLSQRHWQQRVAQRFRGFLIGTVGAVGVLAIGSAQAEDIQIYQALVGGVTAQSPSEKKPNILLLLDTSGSMARPDPVLVERASYDPEIDYSLPTDDAKLYVYDQNFAFTGLSLDRDMNSCAASQVNLSEQSFDPRYRDKMMFWEVNFGQSIGDYLLCTARQVQELRLQPITADSPILEAQLELAPGAYSVEISSLRAGQVSVTALDHDGNKTDSVVCERELETGFDTRSCAPIQISPLKSSGLQFEFEVDTTKPAAGDYVAALVAPLGGCDAAPAKARAIAGWALRPEANHRLVSVECAADDGRHGDGPNESVSSDAPYPRHADPGDPFGSKPKYTSDADDSRRIDWRSSTIEDAFLVSANYHAWSQSASETLRRALQSATEIASSAQLQDFCQATGGAPITSITQTVDYVNSNKYLTYNGKLYQCKPRLRALKEAGLELLSTLSGVNVGLMRFNFAEGAQLLASVQDVDALRGDAGSLGGERRNRDYLAQQLTRLPAGGWTPLQESLHEAALYFAGELPASDGELTLISDQPTLDVPDQLYEDVALADNSAIDRQGRFISPISNQCQDNSIILFSDGEATRDIGRGADIQARSARVCEFEDEASDSGDCLDEIAWILANTDIAPRVDGNNRVYLYTIGFGQDLAGSSQLENASNQALRPGNTAGSQHFTASTARDLVQSFRDIIENIRPQDGDALAAPAVSVDAFNRLEFDDELYFAVFEPSNTPRWYGNVKKYRIATDGQLVDATGKSALDADGFFREDALSIWSDEVDGNKVRAGGAAKALPGPPRTLFANLAAGQPIVELTEENFLAKVWDPLVSEVSSLGAVANPDLVTNRNKIVAWTFGRDIDQELGGDAAGANFFLGESLHNSAVVVDYGDPENGRKLVFVTSNQGLMHAFDAATGEELWSYIADPALFANLGTYFNKPFAAPHKYGLDGPMLFDVQRSADLSLSSVNMVVGQRRGGSKYFALDLSNADGREPGQLPLEKRWILQNLPRQAQSWAKPVAATIKWCPDGDDSCAPRQILVISGGYDPRYDDFSNIDGSPRALTDLAGQARGNAIYMVDQASGELLWIAGRNLDEIGQNVAPAWLLNDEMQHAFPAAPSVIDADFDGLADLLFAIDIAGRIWRIDMRGNFSIDAQSGLVIRDESDIHAGDNQRNGEMGIGIIADLSEPGVHRRFYNALDIARTPATEAEAGRYNIVVGSGFRAQPLLDEGVDNRLYFVFDRYRQFPRVVGPTGSATGVPDRITYNYVDGEQRITIDNLPAKTNQIELDTLGDHKHGFHLKLANGTAEKVLNPTLTNDGLVIATTYRPTLPSDDPTGAVKCQGDLGKSFLYQIDLFTGQAALTELTKPGIAPAPVVIEVGDPNNPGQSVKVLVVGIESFSGAKPPQKIARDGDFDALTPGLNPSDVGKIERVNWWERRPGR